MKNIIIKEYQYPENFSDLELLISGHQQFIRELEPHIAISFVHKFDLKKYLSIFFEHKLNKVIYIAYVNNDVAGYVSNYINILNNISVYRQHRFAVLNELFVLEKFRQVGVASELIEQSKKWANAEKCEYLNVGYSYKNNVADRLYNKKAGFIKTGQLSIYKLNSKI